MTFERKQLRLIGAASLVFALIFGVRQSQVLFIGPLNTQTGLGIAAISLAFAWAQLMWGITQPIAGALADKYGSGRVIATGGLLVTIGTVLTPYASTTVMLILLIGVVAAGGAGMAGLGVLMSAVGRALPPERRGLANGIVMLSHQAGGFLGAWLGGVLFERTGSYDWMWYLDIMLALGAALIHLPIKEAPKRTAAAAA